MARFLTAADAIIMLTIPGLFSTPQQLQGFSADNVYDMGDLDIAETAMGVDGKLSAGYVFNPVEQSFTLMASSESNDLFETWAAASRQGKTVFPCNGSTTLPATQRSYISTNGYLVRLPPMPGAGKILQQRKFTVRWESVQAVPA